MKFNVKNRINCYLECGDGHIDFTVTPIAVLKVRMFPNIIYTLKRGLFGNKEIRMEIINLTDDEHINLLYYLMTEIITLEADMEILRNIKN